jgi:hypothetical protein
MPDNSRTVGQLGLKVQVLSRAGFCAMCIAPEVDAVMAAIGCGRSRTQPAAAQAGKKALLANRALVVGVPCSWRPVRDGAPLPIDSEHSAVFQSLPEDPVLVASGRQDRVDRVGNIRKRDFADARPGDAKRGLRSSQLGDTARSGGLRHHDEQSA